MRARAGAYRWAVVAALLACVFAGLAAPGGHASDGRPGVTLSRPEAAGGTVITVTGTGWRPKALLTLLVCGQNMAGGTNACANADGRAVTTDAAGRFARSLPVTAPPKPCPCVVHVATVTGDPATADAALRITGHPVAPLPEATGGGRLAVLAATRLEGSSGVLVWFGAPARRRLVLTVGNLGTAPIKDPVFQVGTAHGVFAPQWEERQWRGTVQPGRRALVELPVQLTAGAHGDYQVSVKYGGKVLAEQPWRVGRPWGVTLFWALLAVVVPAALYRAGMAVVDRVRPGRAPGPGTSRRRHGHVRSQGRPSPPGRSHRAGRRRAGPSAGPPAQPVSLPWFTPDSAPSENRPTTKGHS
ncbi:neocarzinostatin apoprotein domain-containing protein [Streptomyces ficellus]|uniref:neocarzinostatin apoprotein domain-containing protein n=1 Tax=Streptomyces ficellus TaxID=1977088 RepID=UPI001FCC1050|nr:neocarzinostatin apoprotein domain-containing protein [Streptomyces ficellus]